MQPLNAIRKKMNDEVKLKMGCTPEQWEEWKKKETRGKVDALFGMVNKLETVQKNLMDRLNDVEQELDRRRC